MAKLTAAQAERYETDGYVVPSHRLAPERVGALRKTLDDLIESNPDVRPERLVSIHIEGRNNEGVVGSQVFLDLARDPDILDLVEQVLGPDIILWGCQIFCKPGGDGLEVPMHQDGHYWPIRPLANCTVWVALDDSTVENGCLRVVPGSQLDGRLLDHETSAREDVVLTGKLIDELLDEDAIVDVELEAGQMSMHDIYMVHGSNPNHSTRRRAGVAIRYMPATSLFDRNLIERRSTSGYVVDFGNRPLWLLRGEDRAGNDFEIGHPQAVV